MVEPCESGEVVDDLEDLEETGGGETVAVKDRVENIRKVKRRGAQYKVREGEGGRLWSSVICDDPGHSPPLPLLPHLSLLFHYFPLPLPLFSPYPLPPHPLPPHPLPHPLPPSLPQWPKLLGEPRGGKKLLVLDIDYTLFDHVSPAETAAELARPCETTQCTGACCLVHVRPRSAVYAWCMRDDTVHVRLCSGWHEMVS